MNAHTPTPGRFIVFEGGEGSGKSTQAALLAGRLDAVLTRQPGGTAVGTALRSILLDPDNHHLSDRAEALLMAADRAQHVDELIRPSLASGRHVVCDRYTYSSLAYQGYARGLDLATVRNVSAWATADLWPDLVVLLDLDVEAANRRLDRDRDRFEQVGDGFHQRVRDGFLSLARDDADRWIVLDAARPVEELADEVWTVVAPLVGVDA